MLLKTHFDLIYSGFVDKENVKDFEENRNKFEGKCRSKIFTESMRKIEEYIEDPNSNVQPTGTQIEIKEERDDQETPFEVVSVPRSLATQIDVLKEEKTKMVDELMTMKADNQKLFLDLQYKNRDIEHLKHENQSARHELKQFAQKLQAVQHETERFSRENKSLLAQVKTTQIETNRLLNENKLLLGQLKSTQLESSCLSNENKSLIAQVKQLKKSGMENVDPNNSDLFEVDDLLKHRVVAGKRSLRCMLDIF